MENSLKEFFKSVVLSVLIYLALAFISIAIISLIFMTIDCKEIILKIIMQIIKVVCMFISLKFFIKGDKGLIKGILIGALDGLSLYLIFTVFKITNFIFKLF